MSAFARRSRQALDRAEASVEARVQERVQAALAEQQMRIDAEGGSCGTRSDRRQELGQELASNVLLLFTAAAVALFPPVQIARFAPVMASAPTVLALFGIYRVAQRPIARAISVAMEGMRSVASAAASWVHEAAQHPYFLRLVCEHGARSAPCFVPAS